MAQGVAEVKTLDLLKFARAAACGVTRLVGLVQATHPGGDQQSIGEDIQHGLSPFHVLMTSFAMKSAMIRIRKPAGL
jgi:hypothetical protein